MHNTFMDWFGLTAPIVQAPIAGNDTPRLAAEVARGGGLGSLALTWDEREAGLARVAELNREGTPYFLNFVLHFGIESLRWYADCGAPAITLSWGIDAGAIAFLRGKGMRVGVQVGSANGAAKAIAAGADFIIAQGNEAGGHVQSTTPLRRLLPDVLKVSGDVPVVATGGVSSAPDIAWAIATGAQAVMMGTRFVASTESNAHPLYKQALIAAAPDDTVYTNCFDVGWPFAMHRVLRNSTLDAWEAAGCPAAPARPGEGDIVLRSSSGNLVRYHNDQPKEESQGDILAGCLYAGTSVGAVTSVLPARQIVETLWAEAKALL
jgi:NAD(P)H-dependent flavin oxidoreductase YrpB (nitropropane dioxygenase family)